MEHNTVIRTQADVAQLGTIMGIWAHPDDEAYLSGGLMSMATDAGARVVCVTATRGERGTADPVEWPPDRLGSLRAVEMARCLEILGVTEHHWLGYRDGGCAAIDPSSATERLCELIEQVGPDTVLTFGDDGITGHPDHQAVGSWAAAAVDRVGRPGMRLLQAAVPRRRSPRWDRVDRDLGVYEPGFPVGVPDRALAIDLALPAGATERKVRALTAQQSQTSGLISLLGRETYAAWVSDESFAEQVSDSGGAAIRLFSSDAVVVR